MLAAETWIAIAITVGLFAVLALCIFAILWLIESDVSSAGAQERRLIAQQYAEQYGDCELRSDA